MSTLTQIQSLKQIRKSKSEQLRQEVLAYIGQNPGSSARDVAVGLNMPTFINSITARIAELSSDGFIVRHGQKLCQYSNKTVSLLWPSDSKTTYDIQHKRSSAKFLKSEIEILKIENQELRAKLSLVTEFINYMQSQNMHLEKLALAFRNSKIGEN